MNTTSNQTYCNPIALDKLTPEVYNISQRDEYINLELTDEEIESLMARGYAECLVGVSYGV
jgi:hypothetical protein